LWGNVYTQSAPCATLTALPVGMELSDCTRTRLNGACPPQSHRRYPRRRLQRYPTYAPTMDEAGRRCPSVTVDCGRGRPWQFFGAGMGMPRQRSTGPAGDRPRREACSSWPKRRIFVPRTGSRRAKIVLPNPLYTPGPARQVGSVLVNAIWGASLSDGLGSHGSGDGKVSPASRHGFQDRSEAISGPSDGRRPEQGGPAGVRGRSVS
jgi:hypothetical protein